MSKIVDSTNTVIKEAEDSYIERLYECLTGDIYEVTEQDEVMFGADLNLEWHGKLRIEL